MNENKMLEQENELWDEDIALFEKMEGNYQSSEERNFFKNIKFKQEYELSCCNDLLLSEYDNKDGLYLVRLIYDEYILGLKDNERLEQHVMNLSEVLSINLKDAKLNDRDITFFQWLKENNYRGIRYDRNYDFQDNGQWEGLP